jgi:hypothetical protein
MSPKCATILIGVAFLTGAAACSPNQLETPSSVEDSAFYATLAPGDAVAGPHGSQPGQPIDDWGNVLISDAAADRLAQAGGFVRINFRLGPHASDTAAFYAAYDTIVNRLRARGLQILGLMSNESWRGSQDDWTENSYERSGGDGYNDYIDQFGYAFARIAKHYEGKIGAWEIWNEPNCWAENPAPGVYRGCSFIYPSNFAAMLTHCHSQVHYYSDVDVQVVSGGLFGHDLGGFAKGPAGVDYLDSTYDAGINRTGKFGWARSTYGRYPLDAVGQHIYINQGGAVSTSWFRTYLDWMHGIVTKWEGASSNKPTWITEFGWTQPSVSEATQASNLAQAMAVMKAKSYVAHAIWFQNEDGGPGFAYGLFRGDGSKKPAQTQFRAQAAYQGKKSDGTTVKKILDAWVASGGMAGNGSPYDNGGGIYAHFWDYGYVQDFKGGSVGSCAIFDTGYRVAMGFWQTYLHGGYHDKLRFPTSGEYAIGGGAVRQDFQGGYMLWDARNGVRVY